MKKRISVFFVLFAFITCLSIIFNMYKPKAFAENIMDIKSKSAYLCDANSGTVIYKCNEDKKLPIASMCKIMTLLLCFESIENGEISLNEEITVSENAASMGGSQIFLEANGNYLVSDVIKGITVASANDGCVAMAERICGSEENFVEKMNKRANELGMSNTHFVNCTGLPKSGQFSCAKDVSVMFSELLKHEDYYKFSKIWMDKIQHPKGRITEISNTNKLIRFYDGCDSGKTGYTSEAGHCLCASATRNDMRLICVVISSPDSKTRFKEVSNMFNYGFANYVNKIIVDCNNPLDVKADVLNGKKDSISVVAEKSISLFSSKTERHSVDVNFKPAKKVVAPIMKGDVIGEISVYDNGVMVGCVNAISNEDVAKKTYFDDIIDITKNWAII